jgi:hypothetical protein
MASQFDVNIAVLPVVLTGATQIPIMHVPAAGGGITVLEAKFINGGTAVGGLLVTMTNAGTPAISGTVGAFTTPLADSATIPGAFTVSDGFVEAGEWIGYDQTSGTVPAGSFVSIAYVMGKA